MNPHSSVPPDTNAGRDGGGLGITAIAVIFALLVSMIGIFDSAAGAAPQIGQAAPDFTAADSKGNPIHLREYRGLIVPTPTSTTAAATCKACRPWRKTMASCG